MKSLEFCQSFRCHGLSSLQSKVCPKKKQHTNKQKIAPPPKKNLFSLFSMLESFLNTQSPGTQKNTVKKNKLAETVAHARVIALQTFRVVHY